jgi:hypothetical protein
MFVFLWDCSGHNYITGLVISVGRSQYNDILTHTKVTSHELYQPKSGMPRYPADGMLFMKVMCEQGSTLVSTVTQVAAVARFFASSMALKHQQHKASCYYDVQ